MTAAWPQYAEALVDEAAEESMLAIMEIIKAVRNMRSEVNVAPGRKVPAILLASDELKPVVSENEAYIRQLASVDELEILTDTAVKPDNAMTAVTRGIEVYLPLKGLIDVEKETQRLNKEIEGMAKELARIEGKLGNEGFLAKAPEAVVAKEKAKAADITIRMDAVTERLVYLKKL